MPKLSKEYSLIVPCNSVKFLILPSETEFHHFIEQIEGYGDDQLGELGAYPFSADLHPDDDAEFRRQLKHMGGCE